ncbi:hypothetical protein L1887_19296 [Cichorium endivia]|nr:hypothetical protein L1887_19296 [Cichorium endivia]
MNLRSGKIVCKRHRHSSACSDEIKEEEDIISKLPDALLTEILSYLPEADANRTRILSKRWKDIWAFLPNLRLVMPFDCSIEEANKFHDSVDQIIALRGGMNINRVSLCCSKNCDYNRVYDWLCTVVKCKVQEIELEFSAERFLVKFCWSLFKNCNTLVGLTLRGQFVLDVHEAELLFPCLKKLNLLSIVYSRDQSLTNLISGCPVLEELQVISRPDNMKTFKGLQERNVILIPIFHNLVKFEIGVDYRSGWFLLPHFLEHMPNLEHITFLDGLVPFVRAQHTFNMRWNPPTYLPNCLRFKLKEIIIRNRQAITQQEFPLIAYLLKCSYHLRRLSINAHNINPMIRMQLLMFPRGSGICRIEFI